MINQIKPAGNGKDRVQFNIKPLKDYVKEKYPSDHPIQIIQKEDNIIRSVEEFLAKVSIWLELAAL
jgi:hypothetical protein